jgi:hypothetical protein
LLPAPLFLSPTSPIDTALIHLLDTTGLFTHLNVVLPPSFASASSSSHSSASVSPPLVASIRFLAVVLQRVCEAASSLHCARYALLTRLKSKLLRRVQRKHQELQEQPDEEQDGELGSKPKHRIARGSGHRTSKVTENDANDDSDARTVAPHRAVQAENVVAAVLKMMKGTYELDMLRYILRAELMKEKYQQLASPIDGESSSSLALPPLTVPQPPSEAELKDYVSRTVLASVHDFFWEHQQQDQTSPPAQRRRSSAGARRSSVTRSISRGAGSESSGSSAASTSRRGKRRRPRPIGDASGVASGLPEQSSTPRDRRRNRARSVSPEEQAPALALPQDRRKLASSSSGDDEGGEEGEDAFDSLRSRSRADELAAATLLDASRSDSSRPGVIVNEVDSVVEKLKSTASYRKPPPLPSDGDVEEGELTDS